CSASRAAGCIPRSTSTTPIPRAIWTTCRTRRAPIASATRSPTRSASAGRTPRCCCGPGMLAGRRVVVTGANGGLGLAIARACLEAGATVGLNVHRDDKGARGLVDQLPDRAVLLPFDVGDAEAIARGVAEFRAFAGGIDGWVNNAGVNRADLLLTAGEARIREQLDVNLLGPILCARAVLPLMLEQRAGVIVNVGSA